MESPDKPLLRIIHFNDVYDIQPNKNDYGGAYYFKAHLDSVRNQNTITLFSGDAFSPSMMSNLFEGWQMVHCLNLFKIDAACFGNHEFDYDIEHTEKLAKACNFPWLLGNLIDKRTEEPLGDAGEDIVIQRNGLRIGIFGIAEEDWLTLLTDDYQGQLEYIDFVAFARYKCQVLKQEKKCDIIIALTHMRVPNDKKLCLDVPELDFALGGHDHIVLSQKINGVHLLKSGQNFYDYSIIDFYPKDRKSTYSCHNFSYELQIVQKVNADIGKFDLDLKQYIDQKLIQIKKQAQRTIGYTITPLETRFAKIRSEQTNYGDFITDIIRAFYNCDIVMINSGGIRIDQLVPPGPISFGMISNIFDDFLVVKLVPGRIVIEMLENACSKYPSFEGRFLQISGMRYAFDALLPPGSRVIRQQVTVKGEPIDLDRQYKVAMHSYTSKGGDGFGAVEPCKFSVTMENAIRMIALLKRFYTPVKSSSGGFTLGVLSKRTSSKSDRMSKFISGVRLEDDKYYVEIEPKTDGRIRIINQVNVVP